MICRFFSYTSSGHNCQVVLLRILTCKNTHFFLNMCHLPNQTTCLTQYFYFSVQDSMLFEHKFGEQDTLYIPRKTCVVQMKKYRCAFCFFSHGRPTALGQPVTYRSSNIYNLRIYLELSILHWFALSAESDLLSVCQCLFPTHTGILGKHYLQSRMRSTCLLLS